MAIQHARQSSARQAKLLGCLCDSEPQFGQYVFAQRFAWMRRTSGSHQATASVRCPIGSAAGRTLISMS